MSEELPQIFHRIFTSTNIFIHFIKKYRIQAILGTIGLMFFVYGLISLLASDVKDQSITFENTEAGGENQGKDVNAGIMVDVEGAVVKPGVYRISGDARLKDALIAASGMSEDADREVVSKQLNLAQKLTDGAKIYIPSKSQNAKVKSQNYAAGETGSVNINAASISELDGLSGIGAVTAQKIIDSRPYGNVDELVSKKVISKSVFEKIKDKIKVF